MATQAAIIKCPTDKKSFPSKEVAESFAKEIKDKYPEQPQQYAYACEQCPYWHLSRTKPEDYALRRPQWPSAPAEAEACAEEENSHNSKYAARREEFAKFLREGKDVGQIAMLTGVTYQSVRYHLIKMGLLETKNRISEPSQVPTLETIDEQAQKLRAEFQKKLRELEAKKQQLLDAKKLKVEKFDTGITIRRENDALRLNFAEAEKLTFDILHSLPNENEILEGFRRGRTESQLTQQSYTYDPCWNTPPAPGDSNVHIFETRSNANGNVVAEGYERIVTIGGINTTEKKFLECTGDQIRKKTFAADHQNDAGTGEYRGWITPSGLRVREYVANDRDMRAGHWYLPLWTVAAKT